MGGVSSLSLNSRCERIMNKRINALVVIGFIFLPILLTFGSAGTSYQVLFVPQKRNSFYDAMQVAIFCSVGVTEVACGISSTDLQGTNNNKEFDSFKYFQIVVSFLCGITYFYGSAYVSGFFWILFCILLCSSFVFRKEVTFKWHFISERGKYGWFYTGFFIIFSIGLIAFPVSQPWSSSPEPFIRWHPYTIPGELVWRGIFFSYSSSIIYSCAEHPLGKHVVFVLYVGISCIIHSVVMLGMNINQKVKGQPNGNPEHLFSEIPGFFIVGILNLIGVWYSCALAVPNDDDLQQEDGVVYLRSEELISKKALPDRSFYPQQHSIQVSQKQQDLH